MHRSDTTKKLRWILQLNAASCLFFGMAMLLWSQTIAEFLGAIPPFVLLIVGGGLVFNGCHLVFASMRQTLRCYEISYFAIGDFLWVFATAVLVIFRIGITTRNGLMVAMGIAAMVGTFGILQASFGKTLEADGLLSNQVP